MESWINGIADPTSSARMSFIFQKPPYKKKQKKGAIRGAQRYTTTNSQTTRTEFEFPQETRTGENGWAAWAAVSQFTQRKRKEKSKRKNAKTKGRNGITRRCSVVIKVNIEACFISPLITLLEESPILSSFIRLNKRFWAVGNFVWNFYKNLHRVWFSRESTGGQKLRVVQAKRG